MSLPKIENFLFDSVDCYEIELHSNTNKSTFFSTFTCGLRADLVNFLGGTGCIKLDQCHIESLHVCGDTYLVGSFALDCIGPLITDWDPGH